MPQAFNPNWPTMYVQGFFAGNPYYNGSLQFSVIPTTELNRRMQQAWSARRGKQYELDLVQPGELDAVWQNNDGALDPSNTSSPLSPNVLPYRGYQVWASWPPSYNLMIDHVANGGEGFTGASSASVSGFYGTPTVAASATAWQGSNVWELDAVTSASGHSLINFKAIGVGQADGLVYTMSLYVRSITSGANPSVIPYIQWQDANGNTLQTDTGASVNLIGSPMATWTRVTFTSTMPTTGKKVAAAFGLTLTGTPPVGTWSSQFDGIQWEQFGSASTWQSPGFQYGISSGLIERYPQTWNFNGTYGLVNPIGVDIMAVLSQIILREATVMDLTALGATFIFELNEKSGSTTFAEANGALAPAKLLVAGAGGTLTPGTSVTSATPITGKFYGANGPVVNIVNAGAGGNGAGTVIDLRSAGTTVPAANQDFTRFFAFRSTSVNSVFCSMTSGSYLGAPGQPLFIIGLNGSGQVYATSVSAAGVSLTTTNLVTANDGNWHTVFVTMDGIGLDLHVHVDGGEFTPTPGVTSAHPAGCTGEYIGGQAYPATSGVSSTYNGDIAMYAGWNGLSVDNSNELFQSMNEGWGAFTVGGATGDSSINRYTRILGWANYSGHIQTQQSQSVSQLGPANDVAGVDALTALEAVVATEGGRHFVDGTGTINFQTRRAIFNLTTPMWTFGENAAAGEIPYIDIAFDYDTTRISNQIAVTHQLSGTVFNANDTASQLAYGVRNLSRTTQTFDPEEARGYSIYLLDRYKDPYMRIQTITIDVGSNPSLFPTVLQFELGQRVRINRRDPRGIRSTITIDGYIEQLTHNGDDGNNWTTLLQVSPLANPPGVTYASFTFLRTTLAAPAAAGASTITINALPDAATNVAQSELFSCFWNGQAQEVFVGLGATQELNTGIAVGGIPVTSPGYATVTLTLTNPLVYSHAIGEVVAFDGDYSGTNFDSVAVFDSVNFSY